MHVMLHQIQMMLTIAVAVPYHNMQRTLPAGLPIAYERLQKARLQISAIELFPREKINTTSILTAN